MNKKIVGALSSAIVIGFVMLVGLFMAGKTTVTVFVRNIRTPQAIEQARVAAVRQDQVLDSIRTQFTIDLVRSASALLVARNSAAAAQAEALAYQSNDALLNLRIAEEMANGLAQVCRGVSVCVVGGSVMDTWANATGAPRR